MASILDCVNRARQMIATEAEECRAPPPSAPPDQIQARLRRLLRHLIRVEQQADLMEDLKVKSWETINDVKKRLHQTRGTFGPDVYAIKLLDRMAGLHKDLLAFNRSMEAQFALRVDRSFDVLMHEDLIDVAFDAAIALEASYESRFS
ncbi:hypothetical protein CcrKarma_gp168 [Caulobacter virus Karma]|uniref:Uncharacterized protein n=1 Tax=Caulobacter phage CcrSwift TaxID=2927984 RepID=K4JTN7_9CAUD|nr:hypothetical protein CcrKarma_gp168 [Caulobacter virus Karma]YP_006989896.1 hypothetical protein D870_gp258 [Caulobacter phage CcrSwift]AFU87685.1 hypothetical protein CcrKarma_gp168 [Caulobacter virus Karma]AFU88481.1 hypothetical protein CcrSwift_gp163 [Caulobacter phage CcrSwift]ARB14380.1 hypothetical protein Ccr5_gp160c [Caulobacter phage Ccr5]